MPDFKVVVDGKTYIVDAERQPSPEEAKAWLNGERRDPNSAVQSQPMRSDAGFLGNLKENLGQGISNSENWPTLAATAAGTAASFIPGGAVAGSTLKTALPKLAQMILSGKFSLAGPAIAAGTAGAAGELGNQIANPEQPFDLSSILREGVKQGAIDFGAGKAGSLTTKGGAKLGASGSGLSSTLIRRNFPTALDEQMSGGRFGMPIFSQSGVERVMDRTLRQRNSAIDASPFKTTAVDIANRVEPQVIDEAMSGAALPQDETGAISKLVQEFIDQHSTKTTVPNTAQQNATTLQGWAQPSTITKTTPQHMSAREVETLKEGLDSRAAGAHQAATQNKLPLSTDGRTIEGLSHGARQVLEENVPGIQQMNTKLQGLMGLGQGMNPTFRSVDELIAKGVSPEVAEVATSPIRSQFGMGSRLTYDAMGAGGTFAATNNPFAALATALGIHMATSPTAQRVVGGLTNLSGRALPNSVRAARGATAANTNPPPSGLTKEEAALMSALSGYNRR